MRAQMYFTVLSLVMLTVLGILILVGGGYALVRRSHTTVRQLRARGVYPQPGKESDEDVDRLLQHGHRIEAIKVYRGLSRHLSGGTAGSEGRGGRETTGPRTSLGSRGDAPL